jgi:Rrf2 family iron-sulfur cluster assembly transcriptional regulator
MRLTTRGRYAVTAMLDVALHSDAGPVSVADIASRQGISQAYLEQLFARLRKHRLVHSVRGPGGGYELARLADAISVADIIDSVAENIDATRCGGTGDCQDGFTCLTHELWADLSAQIHDFLADITLASLVARREIAAVARRQERLAMGQGPRIDARIV